jgi:hypothetical protein
MGKDFLFIKKNPVQIDILKIINNQSSSGDFSECLVYVLLNLLS